MTRPDTTTSPSPQLASITRSSAPLIGFCVNITPGTVRREQRLDHDADARPREEADALAIGDRGIGVRRPPDFSQRGFDVVGGAHVEQREVLTGEAGVGTVLVDGRRTARPAASGRSRTSCITSSSASVSPSTIASTISPESAMPRRDRQAAAGGIAEADRLRSVERLLVRVDEGDDRLHRLVLT